MRSVEAEPSLVLGRTEYGDADLIVSLLCRGVGKVSAMARSARRSRKRFGAALGLFTLTRVRMQSRPSAPMWTLQSADPQENYSDALASDVVAMAHGSYGTELVRELVPEEQGDPDIFDLLLELYRGLAEAGPKAGRLRVFEMRLLGALGVAPILTSCAGCHGDLENTGIHWAPGWGGVLCEGCSARHLESDLRAVSAEALALLVTAQSLSSLELGDCLEGNRAAAEARQSMLALLYWHVGKPLKSVEFIANLRNK